MAQWVHCLENKEWHTFLWE